MEGQYIPVVCTNCGDSFSVSEEFGGRKGKCKNCGAEICVPMLSKTAQVHNVDSALLLSNQPLPSLKANSKALIVVSFVVVFVTFLYLAQHKYNSNTEIGLGSPQRRESTSNNTMATAEKTKAQLQERNLPIDQSRENVKQQIVQSAPKNNSEETGDTSNEKIKQYFSPRIAEANGEIRRSMRELKLTMLEAVTIYLAEAFKSNPSGASEYTLDESQRVEEEMVYFKNSLLTDYDALFTILNSAENVCNEFVYDEYRAWNFEMMRYQSSVMEEYDLSVKDETAAKMFIDSMKWANDERKAALLWKRQQY